MKIAPLYFLYIKFQKPIDNIPKWVYNIKHREEEKENKCKALERRKGNGKETKEKAYQVARFGDQCTDRLNHRNNLNLDR